LLRLAGVGRAQEVMPEFSETFGLGRLVGRAASQLLTVFVGNGQRFPATELAAPLERRRLLCVTEYNTQLVCNVTRKFGITLTFRQRDDG